ncbi:MAG TPA: family 43 glycosylhydrolase [Bacteroidota bacterium]|nr:family 43 glycosylhydrolase [Bacteroidota bacterium]
MKKNVFTLIIAASIVIITNNNSFAQNPIIRDQFSADPSARVFGDSVYLYPSHDILPVEGASRPGWFCMEDYHVFSSGNLTDWVDHGVIVSQTSVPWTNPKAFSMWAPDCIYRNGKYYFYFPAPAKDTTILGRGFRIGVAIADKPTGPFAPLENPIQNVRGVDPNPFIDHNGQAYLFWSMGKIYAAKLKENMTELASEPISIQGLPEKGLKEGPFMFERNGIYYLTYPHVEHTTERLEYAMSDNPLGPFKVAGVLMDESPNCWTNHHSIVEFKHQWYLFYHQNDYSPHFDKNRSVRIDSLFFNDDGTIRKVTPTLRGVGVTEASEKIQIDRYSKISEQGASVDFLDTLNRFEGWKTIFNSANAWIQYDAVDFGNKTYKSVTLRTVSTAGGKIELRLDKSDGPLIAEVDIPKGNDWGVVTFPLSKIEHGIHNLIVTSKNDSVVEIDWISFK